MDDEKYHEYLSLLNRLLTSSRIQHSLNVMQVMEELTPIYSLPRVQAMTVGLLHDAAKDLSSKQQLALAEEAKIEFCDPCERHPVYLHALAGAALITKEFGITDVMILDAIAAHSYAGHGDHFDVPLSQCLRFADLLAPSQEWKGIKKFGSMVYAKKIDEASLLQCGWLIEYFQEQGIPVHPNLVNQHQVLSIKLGVTRSFFERW